MSNPREHNTDRSRHHHRGHSSRRYAGTKQPHAVHRRGAPYSHTYRHHREWQTHHIPYGPPPSYNDLGYIRSLRDVVLQGAYPADVVNVKGDALVANPLPAADVVATASCDIGGVAGTHVEPVAIASTGALAELCASPPAESGTKDSAKFVAASADGENNAPAAAPRLEDENYDGMKELLRRLILLEFAERCSQRSIALINTVCETLCTRPLALVKVMEVMDELFADAVGKQQATLLLHYWYIVDATLKQFTSQPSMLNAIVVALPHFIQCYLPWHGSTLSREPWCECERYRERYEKMLGTWSTVLQSEMLEEILVLWRRGVDTSDGGSYSPAGAHVTTGSL
ncbi:hypothetical protein ERJ75_001038900 [Trypanosoma vivax]|uniref:Uncharacterized protein n=1 Tax=Trypanosoma vivax (strain Y486) TaxID=1055687 RepID=G0TZN3_TRYVY|nr:hypothetical protein TRVL_05308 [Trypanosoma vivax]KAH8610924.1 hypothetical protein ERJ75_001038900 [Trypanosoma vivax]CCC50061.1 conserved hypothetical protein [Trypanosoma vivax Y486]